MRNCCSIVVTMVACRTDDTIRSWFCSKVDNRCLLVGVGYWLTGIYYFFLFLQSILVGCSGQLARLPLLAGQLPCGVGVWWVSVNWVGWQIPICGLVIDWDTVGSGRELVISMLHCHLGYLTQFCFLLQSMLRCFVYHACIDGVARGGGRVDLEHQCLT